MYKKIILFFASLILFFSSNLVYAGIVINEVQLYPTGGRFIELYNDSSEAIDLTGWYMQRKTSSGSFTTLVSNTNFEGKEIGAHDYFVISRASLDNSDIVYDSLTLTESNTIQIKKSQEEVIDKIGWGEASDCDSSCPSNPSEGKSIQKSNNGSWVIAMPTPGGDNETESVSLDEDVENSNTTTERTTSTTTSTTAKPKVVEVPSMKAKIIVNTIAFAGQPLEIKTNVSGLLNEDVVLGRVYWNFGDGGSLEQINNFEKFYHTYYYPGEYVLFLEYYKNNSVKIPDVKSKVVIKVVPTTVTISKVGDIRDFFVELSNNASSDIDVSNWFMSANGKTFVLPKNSVILSKKKMTISNKITGFTYGDDRNLKLFSSTGELVSDYSSSFIKAVPTKVISQAKPEISKEKENVVNPVSDLKIPVEDLKASVASSEVAEDHPIRSYLIAFIFTIFVGVSAGAVYFIRKRNAVPVMGADFKILDE